MISDDDKLIVCKTLDNCWWLNLNAQIKCQEIFQSLNRIWNSMHVRIEGREVSSDDSVKFRKLMQVILDGERIVEFSHLSTLEDLAQFSPLIHNDSILVQPHNPSIDEELPKAWQEVLGVNTGQALRKSVDKYQKALTISQQLLEQYNQ